MRIMEDVGDVFVHKTRSLGSFPPAYQEILSNTYRFTGNRYETNDFLTASRTRDTLEIL
jgi:hypothetical protein